MFKPIITEWLEAQKLQWKDSGSGYGLCQCPNPEHNDTNPSAFVSFNEGWISCKSCGYYVNPKTFLSANEDLSNLHLKTRFHNVVDKLNDDHIIAKPMTTFYLPPYDDDVDAYRGLSKEFMEKIGAYKCHTGKFEDRVIFPFYNYEGILVGYTGRYVGNKIYDDNGNTIPKYRHSYGIEPSSHILFGKFIKDLNLDASTLVITEGSHDAYHLLQQGIAASPSLGFRTPDDNWVLEAIHLGVDKVVLAWDNDNAGMEKMVGKKQSLLSKWQEKVATELGLFNPKTKFLYQSRFKDFGEYYEWLLQLTKGK